LAVQVLLQRAEAAGIVAAVVEELPVEQVEQHLEADDLQRRDDVALGAPRAVGGGILGLARHRRVAGLREPVLGQQEIEAAFFLAVQRSRAEREGDGENCDGLRFGRNHSTPSYSAATCPYVRKRTKLTWRAPSWPARGRRWWSGTCGCSSVP